MMISYIINVANTADENAKISELANLTSNGKFSQSKGKSNLLVDFICKGYEGSAVDSTAADVASKVSAKVSEGGMGGETYLAYKNEAWNRLLEFYMNLNS